MPKQIKRQITYARLKTFLQYEPETGRWYWVENRGAHKAGEQAGRQHKRLDGTYNVISLEGVQYNCAQLAVLYMTGKWAPVGFEVDHINRNSLDDRWLNLRIATPTQNSFNRLRKRKDTSIPPGVYQRGKMYRSYIKFKGKDLYLGSYKRMEQAMEARKRVADIIGVGDFLPVVPKILTVEALFNPPTLPKFEFDPEADLQGILKLLNETPNGT